MPLRATILAYQGHRDRRRVVNPLDQWYKYEDRKYKIKKREYIYFNYIVNKNEREEGRAG